jgi:tetratricopeptide (TPR) repeat protein
MSLGVSRALLLAACLAGLSGCESAMKSADVSRPVAVGDQAPDMTATAAAGRPADARASAADVTGAVILPIPQRPPPPDSTPPPGPWTAAADPMDALSLGKRQYREGNYGLAEKHFRTVVEHENVPSERKAEAWIGLAASYDRLKRFDLADRAYKAAISIVGATPEILNNQGFSYMLRGDYARARARLGEALEKDPTNPYIQNNIELLEQSVRGGGGRKKV